MNPNNKQSGKSNPPQQKLLLPKPPAIEPIDKLAKKWVTSGVVVAVLLIASGWMIAKYNSPADNERAKSFAEQVQQAAAAAAASGDSLVVNSQSAGSTVTISEMSFNAVSWVAVRDAKTKWVLGARRFNPGETSGLVYLLRDTAKGAAYEAVIYTDDGDMAFDLHKDALVEGLAAAFTAQ